MLATSRHMRSYYAGPRGTPFVLLSHLIDESFLRKDDFDGFMADRQRRLLLLIQEATGKLVYEGSAAEPGEEADLPGTLEDALAVDAA